MDIYCVIYINICIYVCRCHRDMIYRKSTFSFKGLQNINKIYIQKNPIIASEFYFKSQKCVLRNRFSQNKRFRTVYGTFCRFFLVLLLNQSCYRQKVCFAQSFYFYKASMAVVNYNMYLSTFSIFILIQEFYC